MKKATKLLITAAAVAAVAGVAGVSYAAWSGGSNTSQNVSGSTGQINTIGDITVTPSTASGTLANLNKLCPADQTTAPDGCVKYWEFDLSTSVTGTQTVKYTIKGSLGAGDSDAASSSAKLYWSTSAPTSATTAAPGGTEVSATAEDITADTNNEATVYVYLVADNTDGMNATISLTFAVADAA